MMTEVKDYARICTVYQTLSESDRFINKALCIE